MEISLGKRELKEYLASQLDSFFPDKYKCRGLDIDSSINIALDRLENCFKHITLRGYRDDKGNPTFYHMHSDQYSQFLYFFSNSLWNDYENKAICDKVISLNKILNGMFYSYKCKLPDIFLFGHPVGSIIGNAEYSDYLVIFQNVTINTSVDDKGNTAPKLGKGLFLGAGAKIIGNQEIGDRVSLGVDSLVMNQRIEDDSIILRDVISGKQIIRQRKTSECMAQKFFDDTI